MSVARGSFSVKSSHRFVNPKAEDTSLSSSFSGPDSLFQPSRTSAFNPSNNQQAAGSARGMSVRTTTTAVEDFY